MKLKLDTNISELLALVCVYAVCNCCTDGQVTTVYSVQMGLPVRYLAGPSSVMVQGPFDNFPQNRQAKVQCSFQHHLISSMRQQLATLNKILVITAGFWVQNAPKLFAFGPSSAPDPTGGAKTSPGLVIWGRDTPHSPPHQCIRHLDVWSRFLTILSILSILQQSYVQCPLTVLMYCVKRLR